MSHFVRDKIIVVSHEYGKEVAEGNIPGHVAFSKFGINLDVDNVEEDVWIVGAKYTFPAAAMQMELISSSAEDKGTASPGTGIRTLRLYYLDASYREKTEDITLNGATAVPTTATDIFRVNRLRALTAGSAGAAVGSIDIRHLNDTPIYGRIGAGYTHQRQLIYTVPLGKTVYVSRMRASVGHASGNRYGRFTLRSNWDDVAAAKSSLFYLYAEDATQDGALDLKFDEPLQFPATSDIVVSVISDAANSDAICTASIRGWTE